MEKDLLVLIQSMMHEFSKGQRVIAKFILEHYDRAAFMTAAKLGEAVNISESTVVRFATELGFDGYPKLQKSLQDMVRTKLTSVQRIEVTTQRIGNTDILTNVLSSDMAKVKSTLEEMSKKNFEAAVDAVINAKRIYILGVRSSFALASFLSFYMGLITDDCKMINAHSTEEILEQLYRVKPGDLVIGISFLRYSTRTVRALQFAREKGASVMAITDGPASPLTQYSNVNLFARSEMASFVDSLVAPLSVINALLVAIGLRKKEEVSEIFTELEGYWEESKLYKSDSTKY